MAASGTNRFHIVHSCKICNLFLVCTYLYYRVYTEHGSRIMRLMCIN